MYNVRDMDRMLKSMLIHHGGSNETVKSNFVISCLAFRSSIPILKNSYQPQKQINYHRKILLHSHITCLYYLTIMQHFLFMCFLFQWYFSSLDYAIVSLLLHNRILEDIGKGTTYKIKGFLYCFRNNKNHLEYTHTQRQTYKSPHQTKSLIPNTQ